MYHDLLKFAIKTAKKAGKLALAYQKKGLQIEEKSKNDLVTNADKACEKLIIAEIMKAHPDHAVIGEESSFIHKTSIKNYANAKYIWIVDPIDGTTNYAHQLKEFGISIGLFKTTNKENSKNFEYLVGELIVGVVNAPAMDEIFYASKDHGAYLNGKKIHVTKTPKVDHALFATGFIQETAAQNLPYFTTMMPRCQAIRRLGAASLDLCYVAAGRFDGYWEFDMKPWDIAAGALIVEEAGGTVTDTNGNQIDLFGKDIFASNGKIHQETIKIFQKI
ncbi:inositol monophosphatase [Candidatus Peregrinibacteria bacterium]|nr:inositol monophosphatase [Candidatus Peregrinibacteria bacterium]